MGTKIITSSFGENIKVSIFGGSHELSIGVDITGVPAGISISMEELRKFMARRAPGNSKFATPRKEADLPEFESGLDIKNDVGTTNGNIIRAVIKNTNIKTKDYEGFMNTPRPSHADFTAHGKYGSSVNMSGGGPFSARMTAPLCIAGGIALQALESKGIFVGAHLKSVGNVEDEGFNSVKLTRQELKLAGNKQFPVIDDLAGEKMQHEISDAMKFQDSVGGIVEIAAIGLPVGLGGPMYDGVESKLASILFGIPAVKGVEFGNGFEAARRRGSKNNDPFCIDQDKVRTETNNHGGILGGITSGMPLICRIALKPTPSIGIEQQTVNLAEMKPALLCVKGRHDPCVAVRGVTVAEAAMAIGILDLMIEEFE